MKNYFSLSVVVVVDVSVAVAVHFESSVEISFRALRSVIIISL
jgi:hypothetical protein